MQQGDDGGQDRGDMSEASLVRVIGDLSRALKKIKRDFEDHVASALRRHAHHVGPSERRRSKARRARKAEACRRAREAATPAGGCGAVSDRGVALGLTV